MLHLNGNQKVLLRDFETQLVVFETAQNALSDLQEKESPQPAQKKKSKRASKPERSRKERHDEHTGVIPWNTPIEPFVPANRDPSVSLLPAPQNIHIRIEDDHVETWWNEVDGATEYELWACPQAFDLPEPPADCLYRGLDHAVIFPVAKMTQPGFYHFRVRAVDAAGRPGGWSLEKPLPFHIPGLELEIIPGSHCGELSIHWQPVEGARHYEIQMDQRAVYSSDQPFKCLEHLPLGLHDFKVRPVFSGGATAWEDLPFVQTRLEPPLEITPQEVGIFGHRGEYFLHWYGPTDAPVDCFVILDPEHDRRVLGQMAFQASEKSWFGTFFKPHKTYRWPIPPGLQIEGQRFAVQAVKGKVTGPLSEIKTFPLSGKPLPTSAPKNEVECCIGDLDPTLREFLRKKQVYGKLTEQKLEIYESPSHLRQYSIYHCPVLQAMNLQPRTDYRLSLTLSNGQHWQVEIVFNPKTYRYNLTFQNMFGS